VVLIAAAIVAGVVWYRIGVGGADEAPPRRTTSRATASVNTAPVSVGATTTTARGDRLVVHVAGAVARPGVVELHAGARVIDAVEAAGGAAGDADLDRLNLAARLADGEKVLVQRVGDPPAAEPPNADSAATGVPGTGAPTGPVNLNTATLDQLDGLPGIGPVLAQAILDERARRGRFHSVQELREVRGIGERRFADLADLVTV
jgi:competence protein ComEA